MRKRRKIIASMRIYACVLCDHETRKWMDTHSGRERERDGYMCVHASDRGNRVMPTKSVVQTFFG